MADLTGTSYTGTTWPGSYGPSGQLYMYGGKFFKTPQELYTALGQPYDANALPYGTTVYANNYNSGMSPWDASVRNNALGYLNAPTGGTASMFANPSSATPPGGSPAPRNAITGNTATSGTDSTQAGTGATPLGQTASDTSAAPSGSTTIPGGSPGPTGTAPPPAGNFIPGSGSTTPADVFDPNEDPRQAVYRALLANGYNPDIPTWGMSQLQRRAEDIVASALGRVAWGGNPDILTEPGAFQNYINSLVGVAGRGEGGIMPTAAQGSDYLNSINTLMSGQNRSAGATYLSSLYGSNPQSAAGLAAALRYQGFAPTVRNALQAPLRNFPERFALFTETPEGFATATSRNVLDILLNNLIPGYRPLF